MNIVLIYPFFSIDRVHIENIEVPPIGLHYLGALLKEQGHEVELLNWYDIKNKPYIIQEALLTLKPELIGFSIFHGNRWGGIQLSKIFKEHFPNVPIVFGGIGATFLDDHLLRHFPWIDIIVRGEGEITFPALIHRIEEQKSFDDLPGLTLRLGNTIQKNKDAERIEDLDSLPMPAAHYTFHHLAISRGCPGKCTFCGSPKFWGHKVRFHSADYFVDQLEILYKKGHRFFHFSDDTFTLRKKLVLEICALIAGRKLGITWTAISRVDCIDHEMLRAMRMAGCIQISFGVESGSESIRVELNKKFSEEQIHRTFALTVSYGILARAYIIYGCPGENPETVKDTIRLLRDIRPLVTIFYVLSVFPGTFLYDLFKSQTGATDDIWLHCEEDLFLFEIDKRLCAEMVSQFGKCLKQAIEESIPDFIHSLKLVDDKELFPFHAGFLSRLAVTLDRGDYPHALPEGTAQDLARELYYKALEYAPNTRAYWGLGLLAQAEGDYRKAEAILQEGLLKFPEDAILVRALNNALMRLGREEEARELMRNQQK
ncbi:MAG: radical SAM protein [Deltaproteobacteria bacterium]|nr:radical SAM protein [Deltaproteobacteria bacterium]